MSGTQLTGVTVEECVEECIGPTPFALVRPIPIYPYPWLRTSVPACPADLAALAFGTPVFVAPALPVHPLSVEEMKTVREEKNCVKSKERKERKQKRKPSVPVTTCGAAVYVNGGYVGHATIQMQMVCIVVYFLRGVFTSGLNASWGEIILQMEDLYLADKKLGLDKIKIVVRVLPKTVRSRKLLAKNKKSSGRPGTAAKEGSIVATIFASKKSIIARNRVRATNGRLVNETSVVKAEEVQVKQE